LAGKIVAQEGEHWDELAKRALGSEAYMAEMLKANPGFRYYVTLPAGLELNVPSVKIDSKPQNLPPWKRA
jgi:phage tail protein X